MTPHRAHSRIHLLATASCLAIPSTYPRTDLPPCLPTPQVLSVNFSADGAQLCSGSADCSCIVWDIATRAVKHRIKHREWVEYAAFAPGHDRGGQLAVAACGHDIDIRLWNVEHDQVKLIAMLPAQISYLGMLYFWLRSLIYGAPGIGLGLGLGLGLG